MGGGAPGRVARMVLPEMWDDLQAALHDRCVDSTIFVYLGYMCVCVCVRARVLCSLISCAKTKGYRPMKSEYDPESRIRGPA